MAPPESMAPTAETQGAGPRVWNTYSLPLLLGGSSSNRSDRLSDPFSTLSNKISYQPIKHNITNKISYQPIKHNITYMANRQRTTRARYGVTSESMAASGVYILLMTISGLVSGSREAAGVVVEGA